MQLDQPMRVLGIFTELGVKRPDGESITGSFGVDEYLKTIGDVELQRLLMYIRDWNTHSKHSRTAQRILNYILRHQDVDRLLGLEDVGEVLDALIGYSEKHFGDCLHMVRDCFLIEYTLERMDSIL